MTDHDEKKPKEPTSKDVSDGGTPGLSAEDFYEILHLQLARQRATVIIVADVNDDPIEYNREKPTADAWAFPY